MIRSLCTILLFTLLGCRSIQTKETLNGPIWSTEQNRYLTVEETFRVLRDHRYVIVGEQHLNPSHRKIQARLIQALSNKNTTVALEHLTWKQTELKTAAFEKRGWGKPSLFRPVVEAIRSTGSRVVGINFSKAEIKALYRNQPLGKKLTLILRPTGYQKALPNNLEKELYVELVDSHCGHDDPKMISNFKRIQKSRDALFAAFPLKTTHSKILWLCGAGHARKDRGVPLYLKRLGKPSLSLLLKEVPPDEDPRPEAIDTSQWDLVWYTPEHPIPDPCKGLREKLKSKLSK